MDEPVGAQVSAGGAPIEGMRGRGYYDDHSEYQRGGGYGGRPDRRPRRRGSDASRRAHVRRRRLRHGMPSSPTTPRRPMPTTAAGRPCCPWRRRSRSSSRPRRPPRCTSGGRSRPPTGCGRSPGARGVLLLRGRRQARAALASRADADWTAFLAARAADLAPGGSPLVQMVGTDPESGGVTARRLLRAMWKVARAMADAGALDPGAVDRYCRSTCAPRRGPRAARARRPAP